MLTDPSRRQLFHETLRITVAGTFATLALLILVLVGHAASSSDLFLRPALFLTVALALLAVASLSLLVLYAWAAYPAQRRAILFVVILTLATLTAHMYIVNSPPAAQAGTLSGSLGTQIQDQQVSVNSSISGQTLTITIYPAGGNAIANPQIGIQGALLSGPGFGGAATLASPLTPGHTLTGTWTVSGTAGQLLVEYELLSCYSISSGNYGCIMDESYYVPSAQNILAGTQCAPYAPNCNMEHPPLAKALIAGGMAIFGEYNALSWRIFPILLGTFSIPVLFGIAWKLSGDKRVAYFSALLLALDVMFFSQSSAALLDVPLVFFGLLAAFVYVWEVRVWRLDRYILAGIFLALAALSKESAIFVALSLLTYHTLFGGGRRRERIATTLKMALVLVLVFSAGLQTYDSLLAKSAVPVFTGQVSYIISYGSSLTVSQLACQPTTGLWCKFQNDPGGPPIIPTDWLVYYYPVNYYATSVTVCPNSQNGVCQGGEYTYVALAYYGVTNLLETWTTFVWVPLAIWLIYKYYKSAGEGLEKFGFEGGERAVTGDIKFAGFAVIWFLWNYVSYLGLTLEGRVTYPFYFVPAIPAVAMGAAFLMTKKQVPKWAAYVYLGMVFVFFFIYFPDKAFLPDWLRVIIAH